MNPVSYEYSRNLISDGDIVFVKNGNSLWSKIVETGTHSDIYHCGIAFWVRDPHYKSRLMVVEAYEGGRRIVSMSSYAERNLHVIASPVEWIKHCDEVIDNTGLVPYSYAEGFWIGVCELLRIKRWVDDAGEVCSKMIALYLQKAGVELETTDVSPARLLKVLIEKGYTTRCLVSNAIAPVPNLYEQKGFTA